jgi:hypothetical protein
MRIAVIGTGGIGGPYGASLAKAGAEVTFVARGAHLAAMRENGLRIEGDRGEGIVTETGFEGIARRGRIPAWISSPTADIASRFRGSARNLSSGGGRCLSVAIRGATAMSAAVQVWPGCVANICWTGGLTLRIKIARGAGSPPRHQSNPAPAAQGPLASRDQSEPSRDGERVWPGRDSRQGHA